MPRALGRTQPPHPGVPSLSRNSAPDAQRAAIQVARLIALGYSVAEGVPPLAAADGVETVEG